MLNNSNGQTIINNLKVPPSDAPSMFDLALTVKLLPDMIDKL